MLNWCVRETPEGFMVQFHASTRLAQAAALGWAEFVARETKRFNTVAYASGSKEDKCWRYIIARGKLGGKIQRRAVSIPCDVRKAVNAARRHVFLWKPNGGYENE